MAARLMGYVSASNTPTVVLQRLHHLVELLAVIFLLATLQAVLILLRLVAVVVLLLVVLLAYLQPLTEKMVVTATFQRTMLQVVAVQQILSAVMQRQQVWAV
jgi:hypothetical protein